MTFSGCLICRNSSLSETSKVSSVNAESALQIVCKLFNLPSVSQLGIVPHDINQCGLCKVCGETIQHAVKIQEEIQLLTLKIERLKDDLRESIVCGSNCASTNYNVMLPSSVAAIQKFLSQCLSSCRVRFTPLTEVELRKYLESSVANEDAVATTDCLSEPAPESVESTNTFGADPDFLETEVGVPLDSDLEVDPSEFCEVGGSDDEPKKETDSALEPNTTQKRKRRRIPPDQRKPRKRTKIFRCRHCKKRTFKLQRDLAKHLAKAHDDEVLSVCKYCGFDFQAQRRLRYEHEHTAASATNTSTPVASTSTVSSTPNATKKSSKSTSNPPKYVYVCGLDGCKLSYDSLAKLRIHHHSKCLENPKVQASLSRQFPCSLCSKIYSKQSDLKYHIATIHDKTFRFCCEMCGKGYHQFSELKKHYIYHSNELNFKCEECGMQFRRQDQLVTHRRKHTGELPYICEVCGKGFSRSTHLSRHRDGVHGEPKFPCEICGSLFRSVEYVKQHVNATHLSRYKYERKKQKEKTAEDADASTASVSNAVDPPLEWQQVNPAQPFLQQVNRLQTFFHPFL